MTKDRTRVEAIIVRTPGLRKHISRQNGNYLIYGTVVGIIVGAVLRGFF